MITSLFTEYNSQNGNLVTPLGKWIYHGPDITVLIGASGSQISTELKEGDSLLWDDLIEFECVFGEFVFNYILFEGEPCEQEGDDFEITVKEAPIAKITEETNPAACMGLTVCDNSDLFTLNGEAFRMSDGRPLTVGVIYRWYQDCVLLNVAGKTLIVDPELLVPGSVVTYSLQLEHNGCLSQTACVGVTVDEIPTPGDGGLVIITEGTATVDLLALAVANGLIAPVIDGFVHIWRDPVGNVVPDPSVVITSALLAGLYSYTLEVKSLTLLDCSKTATYDIMVTTVLP